MTLIYSPDGTTSVVKRTTELEGPYSVHG